MNARGSLGLGLIGCGGFGEFCLDAFSQMAEVHVAAVADTFAGAAERLGATFGVPAETDPMALIAREEVNLVHVATPPSSHHELVMASIAAGKHVLCEKPLATRLADADEMLAAAEKAALVLPVNFVLRYNPVTDAVKAVIDSGALGKVLGGRLTNCAGDSKLGPGHWFWDKPVSGGIFVEHGVHFFDLYTHWLGAGEVIDAHTETRENSPQEDRVMCTLRFESGAVANHYHGFDQVLLLDRTDHRLVCELGDIRVDGWIPLSLSIDAVVDDEAEAALRAACPRAEVEVTETYEGEAAQPIGRGVRRHVSRRIRLDCTPRPDKQSVYADSVRALLADQIAYIRDRSHPRRIAESNGRAALALATRAVELAAAKE